MMPNSDILSDGTFNLHQTIIMDSFSCILFLRQLHLGLNMYSFINFMQSRNNYIFNNAVLKGWKAAIFVSINGSV